MSDDDDSPTRAEMDALHRRLREAVGESKLLRPRVRLLAKSTEADARMLVEASDCLVHFEDAVSSLPDEAWPVFWARVHNRAYRGEAFKDALTAEIIDMLGSGWNFVFRRDDRPAAWIDARPVEVRS